MDPTIRIRYRADRTREKIDEVELTRSDGTIETFSVEGDRGAAPGGSSVPEPFRVMDCVDCHNRPTHVYRMPQDEVDHAIEQGRIDRSLPFIRREGLRALQGSYGSHEEARRTIRTRLAAFYQVNYPALAAGRAEPIGTAARELGDLYCSNVFPSMKITWGTYPSHVGHQNSPGCFRCHDEAHKTAAGRVISQDCSICHAPLALDEENPEILKQLQP